MIAKMRCHLELVLLLSFAAPSALAQVNAGESPYRNNGSVLVGLGQKTLSRKDWDDLQNQREAALSGAIGNRYAQLALRLTMSEGRLSTSMMQPALRSVDLLPGPKEPSENDDVDDVSP